MNEMEVGSHRMWHLICLTAQLEGGNTKPRARPVSMPADGLCKCLSAG